MNVVVVESPSKAKTINKYLGPDYEVLASFGHIRDLPPKDGSVDPEQDFRMLWEVDAKSNQRINDIARALKGADKLILATDPDREGEAISWHVLEVLKEKRALKDQEIERVVFNARFSFRASTTCQEMASPSRSGSVARMSFSAPFMALAISETRFAPRLSTSQIIWKSCSGSTEPSFGGRSRIWPNEARTS